MNDEIFISFDIEADGPFPPDYSMLSIGFSVSGWTEAGVYIPANPQADAIYLEIAPISDNSIQAAMDVNKLDRDRISNEGFSPVDAMNKINIWLENVAEERSIVLVAYPSSFDWNFLSYYFHKFHDPGPPISFTRVCDLRTYIVAKSKSMFYSPTEECIPERLLPERARSHHALTDAIEQSVLFNNVHQWNPND